MGERHAATGQVASPRDAVKEDRSMQRARDSVEGLARIKVVGAGGGGSNAIDRILAARVRGIDLIAVNTDNQALARSEAPSRIQIGEKVTRGLGAGGNP